jgi:UTP--glucose-1-phosphate uridylyltransferase
MAAVQAREGGSVIAVEPVEWKDTARYGIVAGDEVAAGLLRLSGIVEKPRPDLAPSNLGVVGRYVLDRRIFELLERTERGAGGEIQLTDGIATLLREQPVYAYRFQGTRYDCGSKLGYVQATIRLALDDSEIGSELRASLPSLLAR